MKEGDLVRHLEDGQTGVVVLAWGVMDVVEVLWDDGETRGQNTCELGWVSATTLVGKSK